MARRLEGEYDQAPMTLGSPHSWFVLCAAPALGRAPLAVTFLGTPLVLFRDVDGRAVAFQDRCPHRNVPLSGGKVRDGQLECPYHGWRFGSDGGCTQVPGLMGPAAHKTRRAVTYATRELDGFIWGYSTPDAAPRSEPFRFPHLDDRRYHTVRQVVTAPGSLHQTLENALDVPHTAFLHGGLFRTAQKRRDIEVRVRRQADRVEAEYVGEPRPSGLVGRLLAPGGGVVEHVDRFLLPSIAQVEYRLGAGSHLVTSSAMTPVSERETRLFAVVSFRLPLPGWLVKPFVTPVALHIFRQDAHILARQSENVARFGGEQFTSTEIDVLGLQIAKLLDAAARELPPLEPHEHRLTMSV